jgi:hypothetical protein
MDEEFQVLSSKIVKYLADATIVSRLSHWNCRGRDFYSAHLLFEKIYNNLDDSMDGLIETLRACSFNPTFSLFSGPNIEMIDYDVQTLVELNLDFLMALNGAIALFYKFAEGNSHDPRLIGISNHLQGMAEVVLNDLYLLQAWTGY